MIHKDPVHKEWRDYQKRLNRKERTRRLLNRLPIIALCSVSLFLVLCLLFYGGFRITFHRSQAGLRPPGETSLSDAQSAKFSRENLPSILKDLDLEFSGFTNPVILGNEESQFEVKTSLNLELQRYIIRRLKYSRTLEAAVVALDPLDGRILAMASYAKDGNGENICLKADYPAASLFKIVSAAAALEVAGLTPDKILSFEGRRHTLYKKQLKEKTGRYVSKVEFKRAFANSINSIFGKLGIYQLGQKTLAEYAGKFLFNQFIPFDLPVDKSKILVPVDDFGLAEIASGFNKKTLVSPMHVALLASAVANGGTVMAPWLVGSIKDKTGKVLYRGKTSQLANPISMETSENLKILMRETVIYGTCRKSFRKLRRKKKFKKVDLGAKTGTINDINDRYKYDWVAAYAIPQNKTGGIALAILGVHGKKLGIRARELARLIINYHFS